MGGPLPGASTPRFPAVHRVNLPSPSQASLLACALLLSGCAGSGAWLASVAPPADRVEGLEILLVDRPYEVSASDLTALNRALDTLGPRQEGRRAHAVTGWRLFWSYVPTRAGMGCVCGQSRVRVELVTTLPHWREVGKAPVGLVEDWSLFLGRLRSHEAVHQDLAVGNGRALLDLLAGSAAGDCQSLREEVERLTALLESRYRELHAAFDRDTRFGRSAERAATAGG